MVETSVSHVSHGDVALQRESKESMPREARQREGEEGEGSVISVAESMSKESRWNSTESHSLQTHTEFYSDERDLREHIERAQQAILGENSVQRKFFLTQYDMEIQKSEGRNSEYALSRNESLNLKDDNFWKPINGQIKLNVREYICVANWR